MSRKKSKHKRIVGVWDLRITPVRLGDLLTLVEELHISRKVHIARFSDVVIIYDAKHLQVPAEYFDTSEIIVLNKRVRKISPVVSLLYDLEGINNCYIVKTADALATTVDDASNIVWHTYDTTLFVQKFFHENGFIPTISCKPYVLKWARNFIKHNVLGMPVVVHLKNKGTDSAADFDAWFSFFNKCAKKYSVTFIFIGNEKINNTVRQLPNVCIAKDFDSNLAREMALIQSAALFMGMVSGPANMAIFSDTPYIMYKNPDHHTKQMKIELGEHDWFPFASSQQRILRMKHTSESLMSEFERVYRKI